MERHDREQTAAEIVSRVDILEVISEYVVLNRKGKDHWGNCPFHSEDTPSFSVSGEKQVYYCFGCQEGGNVITFLRKKENLSYFEALSNLAERVGIRLDAGFDSPARQQLRTEKQRFYRINELAANFYRETLLHSSVGEIARVYLQQRGINSESVQRFSLGYAPESWDALLRQLTNAGYAPSDLEKYGLVVARASGGGYYDRFRQRLMFPIFDVAGQITGFGGRIIGEGTPKYLNSPENRFFEKGRILYGLHLARFSIQNQRQVVFVEGYMDALMCQQAGLENVVASMGTALTPHQIQMVLRYSPEIILAYDADSAGQLATMRAIELIRKLGGRVKVLTLGEGKDPDQIIQEQGVAYLQERVDKAQGFFPYKLQQALAKEVPRTAEAKMRVLTEFWEDFDLAGSALERQEYCIELSMALQIPEATIREEYLRNQSKEAKNRRKLVKNTKNVHTKYGNSTQPSTASELAEWNLLRLMVEDPRVFLRIEEEKGLEIFSDPLNHRLVQWYSQRIHQADLAKEDEEHANTWSLAALVEEVEDEALRNLLLQITLSVSPFPVFSEHQKERVLQDYLRTIIQHRFQKQLAEIQQRLRQADEAGNVQQSFALVAEMKEIRTLMAQEEMN